MSDTELLNPCVRCGMCCSSYRVSFYWGEANDAPGGYVPAEMTEQINPYRSAMKGTHPIPQRCIALQGELGKQVSCSIYAQRPSPCRDFPAWERDGRPNEACTRARAKIGLPPLPAIEPNASDEERRAG